MLVCDPALSICYLSSACSYSLCISNLHIPMPFHIIAKQKNIIFNNLDENYFYNSIAAVKETKTEELLELAPKYLQPEIFYELVVY